MFEGVSDGAIPVDRPMYAFKQGFELLGIEFRPVHFHDRVNVFVAIFTVSWLRTAHREGRVEIVSKTTGQRMISRDRGASSGCQPQELSRGERPLSARKTDADLRAPLIASNIDAGLSAFSNDEWLRALRVGHVSSYE